MRKLRNSLMALLCGYSLAGCLPDKYSREDLEKKLAEYQTTHDIKLVDGEADVVG